MNEAKIRKRKKKTKIMKKIQHKIKRKNDKDVLREKEKKML